ncbi:MAG: hypothetical protein CMH55_05345 [Myxococcales bacterium]|nr:hypothetical protein [Myxococcales bacterium]
MSFHPLVLRIHESGELERPFRFGHDLAGPVEDFLYEALADAMPDCGLYRCQLRRDESGKLQLDLIHLGPADRPVAQARLQADGTLGDLLMDGAGAPLSLPEQMALAKAMAQELGDDPETGMVVIATLDSTG